jgi:hypothetical protein
MNNENEESPVAKGLAAAMGEIGRDRAAYENEGQRDSVAMRWAKFTSVIFMFSLLFAAGFALEDYYLKFVGIDRQSDIVEVDTYSKLKFRFYLGGAIGAGLGIAYVVRCLVRDQDP